MIVWWSPFPNAVNSLSVILPSMTGILVSLCQFLSWCTLRDAPCPYNVRGRICGEEALPKAGYWQSQTPSIRKLLVLGTVGTQENITKKGKHREQSSLLSETLHSHEMCWMHSYPSASTDPMLCFQLAEGAAASPRVPVRAQGSAQEGRREVWSRFSPHIDPSPRGSLLHPVLHQGLFVSAALSFPAFWHA